MAVPSKALPITDSCLLLLPGFEPQPRHVRKLPVTIGMWFSPGSLLSSTTNNWPGVNIWQKKKRKSNSIHNHGFNWYFINTESHFFPIRTVLSLQ